MTKFNHTTLVTFRQHNQSLAVPVISFFHKANELKSEMCLYLYFPILVLVSTTKGKIMELLCSH